MILNGSLLGSIEPQAIQVQWRYGIHGVAAVLKIQRCVFLPRIQNFAPTDTKCSLECITFPCSISRTRAVRAASDHSACISIVLLSRGKRIWLLHLWKSRTDTHIRARFLCTPPLGRGGCTGEGTPTVEASVNSEVCTSASAAYPCHTRDCLEVHL